MALYAQIERTSGGVSGTQTFGQMSVVIYDAATNLPTNGNNCVVTYNQNINGVQSLGLTVTVPGTSYPIYTGEISDTNPASPFFTQFYVVGISTSGTGTTDPNIDDLKIVAIVTTPEDAIGANNGTLKVSASSSFPAIQYSIDNSTWQTSNTFTGLPGGRGTVYVKDANGGNLSQGYSIGFLGQVLASDPSVNLGNGNISRWNAAFNPVLWTFQRKDFEVESVTIGPFQTINVDVNADLTGVTAQTTSGAITSSGDMVYLNTAKYQGTYEVLAINGSTLNLNCPYTANDTLGFVNIDSLRPYYQIQMQISYIDPISGKPATLISEYSPNSDGSLKADLSYFVQSLLKAKDNSTYTDINFRDMNLSASYQIQYSQIWNGGQLGPVTMPLPYYVIFAAKQLGTKWAGNLALYVPYLLGFQPAKWLCDFDQPVYSPGFPFDLGFIFSEYMTGISPFYNIELLDINKMPIQPQASTNEYLLNQDGGFQLNQDGSRFIIASQGVSNVPIVQNVGLNRLLLNLNLPDNCYYFTVSLQYTSGGTTYNLMQPITCRVFKDTPDRPVYLRWIGFNGSWNYYRFAFNQIVSLDVGNAVTTKRYVLDWENEDTIEDVISKSAGEKMQVFGENVDVSEINGLQSIKYSPKVQLLTSNSGSPKWQTVIVASGSYTERETMLDQYSVAITFALPSKNIQTN